MQENPGETFTYVVQRGDTLAGVALRLGVKQSELKRANHMYGSKTLMTGQVITDNRGSCCVAALSRLPIYRSRYALLSLCTEATRTGVRTMFSEGSHT